MSPSGGILSHVTATRLPESRRWSFYLINDGGMTIESAELAAVRYEWGDQYVGGESPGMRVVDLEPGAQALIWRDDGSSEMRTDLWVRVTDGTRETWLLFEFPRLYRQEGTTLIAHPTVMGGPPGDVG